MERLPKDANSRKIASRARQLVHSAFSADNWEYHEETGVDRGRDCTVELVENEEFRNHKIEGQFKGTTELNVLKNRTTISFPMEVKTINYGLGCANAFLLLLADVNTGIVYYLPIQDYFIANPALFGKLGSQTKMSLHVPVDNVVNADDNDLQEIARSVYVGGPSSALRRA